MRAETAILAAQIAFSVDERAKARLIGIKIKREFARPFPKRLEILRAGFDFDQPQGLLKIDFAPTHHFYFEFFDPGFHPSTMSPKRGSTSTPLARNIFSAF